MSALEYRAGEVKSRPLPMRTDRFFSAQGNWYFSTREGKPIGPFSNKDEAKQGLDDFLEFVELAAPKTLSQLQVALSA
jgi:hypothetical protein